MADIRKKLILEDAFSGTFGKYVDDLQKSIGESNKMTAATQDLVNKFSYLQKAAQNAGSDKEMEKYLNQLVAAMARAGLEWTTEAGRMQAEDMLMHESLQQLAERGEIAASAIAEMKYAAQTAAEGEDEATDSAKQMAKEMKGAEKQSKSLWSSLSKGGGAGSGIGKTLVGLFSLQKLLQGIKTAIKNAPKSIAAPWDNLINKLKSIGGGFVLTVLKNMGDGLKRINDALNSDAGKKFMQVLGTAATVLGKAIGLLLGLIADLITLLGGRLVEALNGSANAMDGATKECVTLEEVLYNVGAAFGWIGAFVYNIVADVWNAIAALAEFIGGVFNNPLNAVLHLFVDVFDAILGIIETVADALAALFGSDAMRVVLSMGGAPVGLQKMYGENGALDGSINVAEIKNLRSDMQKWADDTFGEKTVKLDRLEKADTSYWMNASGEWLRNVGSTLTDLEKYSESTAGSASSIAKTLSDQDLADIIEAAERHFVAQVNLTAQSPVITVNGANTGNTEADRRALADAISEMLVEQAAYGTIRSSAAMGG